MTGDDLDKQEHSLSITRHLFACSDTQLMGVVQTNNFTSDHTKQLLICMYVLLTCASFVSLKGVRALKG